MRNLTKASRDASRNYQFNKLIEQGATHEKYKTLEIFSWFDTVSYFVKIFKGTAANHLSYYRYRTEQSRDEAIQRAKNTEDSRETWKAEQKERNKGQSSTHAAAASAIRNELNNAFKGFKFSVTSDSFSGGNAVRVHWVDGPTTREVEQISGKYQYGHFNGMEDIYEYSNNNDNLPQVKFVTESRQMSEQTREFITEQVSAIMEENTPKHEIERLTYQIFSASSLPPNAELTGINTDANDWKLTFKKPDAPAQDSKPAPVTTTKGEIKVIDYSEKAIAVIGEGTREIKEELKNAGGKFNKYLSCGAGWIFSKRQQAAVIEMLQGMKQRQDTTTTELKEEIKQLHEPEVIINDSDIIKTPPTNTLKLDTFTIIWHEGKQNPSFEGATFTDWDEVQRAFFTIWSHNEKGQDGGYTKVKCSIKLEGKETETCRINITSRINNGDFNPSQENIVPYIVNNLYEPEELETPQPQPQPDTQIQLFDNLADIRQAANSGQMISLTNLSNLVNDGGRANV
jgi:uncharacterized FlaG/YvyC family protein